MNKKIELLAPAGNIAAGVAAIDAGADAVYCGLRRFSARDRAENFDLDDFARITVYAHERGRKVYLALNTLIKNSELEDAAMLIAKIAETGADAVIVQDIGIVRLIREYFPFLPIHASTQMAIHNSASAKIAKAMGISRVILERQLTLDEIRKIADNPPLELEIFIHGALCCSLSGQCLLSSWLGGYSGNRGRCKQACRFPASDKKNHYPLSTRDLCLADDLRELRRLNITSFKIEGRLRSVDYVRNVVSAYRMLLDVSDAEFAEALREARKLISLSATRDFTGVFRKDFSGLINSDKSGSSGICCGRVLKVSEGGFEAKIDGRIHLGDKIRVQRTDGSSAVSFTVKKILLDGVETVLARNKKVFLQCDREVETGDLIFKIGESNQDNPAKFAKLPMYLPEKIDMQIFVNKDGFRVLLDGGKIVWNECYRFAAAQKRPLDSGTVEEVFSETCSAKFAAGRMEVNIDGDYFIPLSELKKVRRKFWNWLSENRVCENRRALEANYGLKRFLSDWESLRNNPQRAGGEAECVIVSSDFNDAYSGAIRCAELFDSKMADNVKEIILPSFCPEGNIPNLRKRVGELYALGIRRFRITSIGHFEILSGYEDIFITVSFPLQCANSMAFCEFRRLGADKVQLWVELEKDEIEYLCHLHGGMAELFCEGMVPLFYTRGKISGDFFEIRSRKFTVCRAFGGISFLLPEEKFKIEPCADVCIFRDLRYVFSAAKTSTFNYHRKLF